MFLDLDMSIFKLYDVLEAWADCHQVQKETDPTQVDPLEIVCPDHWKSGGHIYRFYLK
jgi:hypothetical protein